MAKSKSSPCKFLSPPRAGGPAPHPATAGGRAAALPKGDTASHQLAPMAPLLAVLPLAAVVAAAASPDDLLTKRCIQPGAGQGPKDVGACLDGSPFCFFELRNTSSTKWAFFFEVISPRSRSRSRSPPTLASSTPAVQGGGACETAEACVQRAGTGLGSSKNLSDTRATFKVAGGDLVEGWNQVFLPYCDGSVWKGTRTKPAPEGYTACGHLNAAATFRTLLTDSTGLPKASHVIVSGASAGGIGAFTHADYVRELPELKNADVRAAPEWCTPPLKLASDV